MNRIAVIFAVTVITAGFSTSASAQIESNPKVRWADVEAIFIQRCSTCHGGQLPASLLRLETREGLLKGSQIGPVVKAGDAQSSILMRRIQGSIRPRMPMNGPPFLSNDEINRIGQWIDQGLAD
jgi:mono/diheme cytochrome c family protein